MDMRHIVSLMLLIVAVIHLLPITGALGARSLERLYGVQVSDPNLSILMRHRAVLFGMLGALLAAAAFVEALQAPAFVAGFVSVGSFLLIAWRERGYNAHVGRVVRADVVAAVCLVVGLGAHVAAG